MKQFTDVAVRNMTDEEVRRYLETGNITGDQLARIGWIDEAIDELVYAREELKAAGL